ncbi:MAG: acyltransferase 3 [Acidobacteria bacterium]|nr:acyltransferase 3 [Acidobacteriota bacterium]
MRNAQLDVLRTVAVLMVILSHLPIPPTGTSGVVMALGNFFRTYGGLGVDLFFVLSGFLVSGLLFREYSSTGHARVGRFLLRRAFKIYPPFYVFLVVTVLLRIQRGDVPARLDMLCEMLFVQNYGPHVWSHTWSLAVEEHFYILLALLVFGLQRWRRANPFAGMPAIFLGATAAVSAARWVSFVLLPHTNMDLRFPTHLQVDSLFFGVLMAFYCSTAPSLLETIRSHRRWLWLGGPVCIIVSQAIPNPIAQYLAGHILAYIGFGCVIMAAVTTPLPGRGRRLVEAAAFVGTHSYSIYLWHTAVLAFGLVLATKLLGRSPGYYEMSSMYVVAAFVWGIVTARGIEWPALALRERLYGSRTAPQIHVAIAPTA